MVNRYKKNELPGITKNKSRRYQIGKDQSKMGYMDSGFKKSRRFTTDYLSKMANPNEK